MHHSSGFSHTDVYTMPVYLRRFYLEQLKHHKELESQARKKATEKSKTSMRSRKR